MSRAINHLESDRFTPKYVDLARRLLGDIAVRELSKGDRLPTENEIAEQYALSRVTVRQALQILEQDGIITRERARGTFVRRELEPHERLGLQRGTVLLVCSNEQRQHMSEDSAFAEILCSVEQALADQGFAVQLAALGRTAEEDRARLQLSAATQNLRGVVSIGPYLEPYRDVFAERVIVTLGTFTPTSPPWIGANIVEVCQQMTQHLLDHGHRRIALVCGGSPGLDVLQPFLQGYQKAIEAAGVKYDRRLVFHLHPGEACEDLAETALDETVSPTAVVVDNWRACEALVHAAGRRGLKIPDDLSVIGYGQNMMGLTNPVPMTAHLPQYDKVGQAAASLLTEGLAGAAASPSSWFIPSRLVERDSVARLQAD